MPKSVTVRARRLAEFDRLSAQLERGYPGVYTGKVACPICLQLHRREDAVSGRLSLAHFPPEALGGFLTTLLCKTCNKRLGTGPEQELIRCWSFAHIIAGQPEASSPATLQYKGNRIRIKASNANEVLSLIGDPGQNRESFVQQSITDWDNMVDSGEQNATFTLHSEPFSWKGVQIAFLGAAYLAVFRAYGYNWIGTTAYEPVRRQLQNPDEVLIPRFCKLGSPLTDVSAPRIFRTIEGSSHEGIVVMFGDTLVSLPMRWDKEASLYSALEREASAELTLRLLASPWYQGGTLGA